MLKLSNVSLEHAITGSQHNFSQPIPFFRRAKARAPAQQASAGALQQTSAGALMQNLHHGNAEGTGMVTLHCMDLLKYVWAYNYECGHTLMVTDLSPDHCQGRFQQWNCNGFTTGFTRMPKILKTFEGFHKNGQISQ